MSINDEDIIELFIEVEKLDKRFARRLSNRTQHCEGQHRCILILEMMGSMNQRKLADALHIRSTSLSELLSKLERKGLVERTPVPDDKRSLIVSLTKEGAQKAKEYNRRRAKTRQKIMDHISDEEKRQFYSTLKKIKENYLEMEAEEIE